MFDNFKAGFLQPSFTLAMLLFIARFVTLTATLYPVFGATLPSGLDPLGPAIAVGSAAAAAYEGLHRALLHR